MRFKAPEQQVAVVATAAGANDWVGGKSPLSRSNSTQVWRDEHSSLGDLIMLLDKK